MEDPFATPQISFIIAIKVSRTTLDVHYPLLRLSQVKGSLLAQAYWYTQAIAGFFCSFLLFSAVFRLVLENSEPCRVQSVAVRVP